jgi:CrcB protein
MMRLHGAPACEFPAMSASGARVGAGTDVREMPDRVVGRLGFTHARTAAILVGGACGTLARAGLAEAVPQRPGGWPWATFGVNLAGAFVLGWLLTRLAERTAPSRYWRPLLGTGFCGALTTFSAFQLETLELARTGHGALALWYPLASVAAGMALAVAGAMAARWGRHW